MKASPPAKRFWDNVPPHVRLEILNKVWCVGCRKAGGIAIETMSVKNGHLIIKGHCLTCQGPVARLVESW